MLSAIIVFQQLILELLNWPIQERLFFDIASEKLTL